MKLSAIVFLIVALLASIAFSVPTDHEYCNQDVLKLERPREGAIYRINSTQIVEFRKLKDCYRMYQNFYF